MKIKKSSLELIAIFILIYIDYQAFRLIPIPQSLYKIWNTSNSCLLVLAGALFWLLTYWGNKKVCKMAPFTTRFIVVTIIVLFLVTIVSTVMYGMQSPYSIFMTWTNFLTPVCSYLIFDYIRRQGIDKLMSFVSVVVTFAVFLLIVQQFLTSIGKSDLLVNVNKMVTRNDVLRFSCGSLTPFVSIYLFNRWYKDRSIWKLVLFITDYYGIWFVTQTRALIISAAICFFVVVIVNSKSKWEIFKGALLISAAVVLMIASGSLSQFIKSFTDQNTSYSDNIARFGAYLYYWKAFLKNPLVGQGFIVDPKYYSIKYGPLGNYYYVDIGIVGLLAQVGVNTIFILFWPIYRWIKTLKNLKNHIAINDFALLTAMLFYILTTLPSLIITDAGRSFLFAFYFAIFDYYILISGNTIKSYSRIKR